jgi:hypothetical protein
LIVSSTRPSRSKTAQADAAGEKRSRANMGLGLVKMGLCRRSALTGIRRYVLQNVFVVLHSRDF